MDPARFPALSRRDFARALAALGGSVALGGAAGCGAAAGPAQPVAATQPVPPAQPIPPARPPAPTRAAPRPARRAARPTGPYGRLASPDENGLALPTGFRSRVIARSGQKVPGTSHVWHDAPDGGACFRDGDGWVYVSNSEIDDGGGGVGALRFGADGEITRAYRILDGTDRNCAGGATTWGTWLSCEEVPRGRVFEASPLGGRGVVRPALGRFQHEAAAVDPTRRCLYLTEDEPDGCLYRFVPDSWTDLSAGRLDVLASPGDAIGKVRWITVPDPSGRPTPTREQVRGATRFDGGEGCVYGGDAVWFTTKGDGRVWRLDVARDRLSIAYDDSRVPGRAVLTGVDNITVGPGGEVLVAEDLGSMDLCIVDAAGAASRLLRLPGHRGSELTGPAFSPDGQRLYFSSQRGAGGRSGDGVTYEVRGPFRR